MNADDFGYTASVNRAIVEAHAQGIVTSTTLMANGAAFADAKRLAEMVPKLSVGCHVMLTDGKPILAGEQLPSLTLTTSLTNSSRFRDGMMGFAARAVSGRLNGGEIAAEASAQIRKIQSAGLHVSHIDTHKHTHLFPAVLRPLLRAAADCGVRAVRNPFGPRWPRWSKGMAFLPGLCARTVEFRILVGFAGQFREAVRREGFATPDGTLGMVVTGMLDETWFRAIARTIPEGTWEFVCHPGYNDSELKAANTRLRESRETELRLLTSPVARELLAEQKIELISYRELDRP